jgi:hypothetical protein
MKKPQEETPEELINDWLSEGNRHGDLRKFKGK